MSHLWTDFGAKIKIAGTDVKSSIEDIDEGFQRVLKGSGPEAAQALLDAWMVQTDALDHSGSQYQENIDLIGRYQERIDLAVGSAAAQTAAVEGTTAAVEGNTAANEGNTASLEEQTAAAELHAAAFDHAREVGKEYDDFVKEATATYDEQVASIQAWAASINEATASGAASFYQFATDVPLSIQSVREELQTSTADVKLWQENLLTIGSTTSPEFVAYLAEMGAAGAPMVADLATNTPELQGMYLDWVNMTMTGARDIVGELDAVGPGATEKLNAAKAQMGQAIEGWSPDLVPKSSAVAEDVGGGFDDVGTTAAASLAGAAVPMGQAIEGWSPTLVSKATTLGGSISGGITAGVTTAAGNIAAAVNRAVQGAYDAARAKWGVASPSKVFAEEIGEPLAQGIAEGVANDAHKLSEAVGDAIEAAEETAVDRAEDLVDAVSDVLDGLWDNIDDDRKLSDLQAGVGDAQAAMGAAQLAHANATKALAKATAEGDQEAINDALADQADAVRDIARAQDKLKDASLALAKATTDMIGKDAESRKSWIATARQAGLTKKEIDDLVAAYARLAKAQADATAEGVAAGRDAARANAIRADFANAAKLGLVSSAEVDAINKLGSVQAQLDAMTAKLNNLSRWFGQVPKYATGGIVPGPSDQGRLAIVHGGEKIIPASNVTGMETLTSADIRRAISDGLVDGTKRVQQLERAR